MKRFGYDAEAYRKMMVNIGRNMLEAMLGPTVIVDITYRDGRKEVKLMRQFDADELRENIAAQVVIDVARLKVSPPLVGTVASITPIRVD